MARLCMGEREMRGVSFIVTVYNKADFLPDVLESVRRQVGDFARELIVVDDGSSDESVERVRTITADWDIPVQLVQQENAGASAATNAGAAAATQPWLKLLDGDDVLLPHATRWLLEAAEVAGASFAYGNNVRYRPGQDRSFDRMTDRPDIETEFDGLARYIRSCPGNSSSMLIGRERFWRAGGCDERLVSPDQALFLRIFACGDGAHLLGPVALIPDEAPNRLSGQKRRSRYESVLALHHLVKETPDLPARYRRLAARRAASRAFRFRRRHGRRAWWSRNALDYLAAKLHLPLDAERVTHRALAGFTEDGSVERPAHWLPGALSKRSWARS